MTNEYRDPLAGLRSQIVFKRSAIDTLLSELTPIRRLVLNPEAIADIDRERAAIANDGDDLNAMSECLRKADALEVLLVRAVERAKEHATLPDHVKPLGKPPWQLSIPIKRLDMMRVVGALTARWKPKSEPWGNAAAARFEVSGHPIVAVARGIIVHGLIWPSVIAVDIALMTSVPNAIPDLAAHVEHARAAMFSSLRPSKSRRTGDKVFDETYFVSGDEQAAKVLLSDGVRKELLAMSAYEVRLRIGGGLAEIGWTMRMDYKEIVPLPETAVRVIVALRDTIANG